MIYIPECKQQLRTINEIMHAEEEDDVLGLNVVIDVKYGSIGSTDYYIRH